MTERPTALVALYEDTERYVAAAADWQPGEPFPLLDGPVLDRYRSVLPGGELPAVEPGQSRDGVVVSTGGELSRVAARLLAIATGRLHQHLAPDRVLPELVALRGRLVAVVGLPDDLAAVGDWPGRSGALVGVLTGRSAQTLSCLVYRSLTVESARQDPSFVAYHPLLKGAMDADAASFAELRHVRDHRPGLLVLHGQGRECCTSVMDGMVCGRAEPLGVPLPVAAGQRTTPCLTGAGCFRTDLEPDDLMPAADVHAGVVFTHSCSAISVGTNAYPSSVSVTLGLLDGTAVAVLGVLGVQVAHRSAQWDLADGLAERLPLGEVAHRMNEQGRPLNGELKRFGLLGDPGLVLPADGDSRSAALTGQPLDEQALDQFARHDLVVSRLERLRWLEVDLPDADLLAVRERIRAAVKDPFDPAVTTEAAAIGDQLAVLQRGIADQLVTRIYSPGWDPGWRSAGFRQLESTDQDCPGCGRPIAVRLRLRHRIDPALHFQTVQCRRCGDVWWSTEDGERTAVIDGPGDLAGRTSEPIRIDRAVRNLGPDELTGSIGYAFRGRKNLGLPPGRATDHRLAPGQVLEYHELVDLHGELASADTHTTIVLGLLNGILVTSMLMLRLDA